MRSNRRRPPRESQRIPTVAAGRPEAIGRQCAIFGTLGPCRTLRVAPGRAIVGTTVEVPARDSPASESKPRGVGGNLTGSSGPAGHERGGPQFRAPRGVGFEKVRFSHKTRGESERTGVPGSPVSPSIVPKVTDRSGHQSRVRFPAIVTTGKPRFVNFSLPRADSSRVARACPSSQIGLPSDEHSGQEAR